MFQCKRCCVCLSSKQCLQKHLLKNKECTPSDKSTETNRAVLLDMLKQKKQTNKSKDSNVTFTCNKCQTTFTSRQAKYLHTKSYCKSITDAMNNNQVATQNNTNNVTIIYNNTTNTNNQNINININNFGSENTNHLTDEFLSKCLFSCNTGIKNLMKEIHFNPQVPENHNIRVYSRKGKILEKYADGGWHVCDQNNTLDEMIRKGYRILFQHLAQKNEQCMEQSKDVAGSSSEDLEDENEKAIRRNENANAYLSKLIRKENIYFELRRDLYMMILDGSFYIIGK